VILKEKEVSSNAVKLVEKREEMEKYGKWIIVMTIWKGVPRCCSFSLCSLGKTCNIGGVWMRVQEGSVGEKRLCLILASL
jgi:hypothetical protein